MRLTHSALTISELVAILIFIPIIHATASDKVNNDDRSLKIVDKTPTDSRWKVALVIGNSNYVSLPLRNPVNDARAMATALRKLGFEVDERINLGYISFNEAVESFGNKLRTDGIGLFYYAGHGMQVNGNNYLIPVDAIINSENEVRYKAMDAGLVLAKMEQAKSDVNIFIMDACRDNPFARSFRSASKGLAQVDAPTGTIIAYATAPGKTASDGEGGNGVYTESLIEALETPGLKVEEVFKKVRKLVIEKTGKVQVPWESSSLVGDFHFVPPNNNIGLKSEPDMPVAAKKIQPLPAASVSSDMKNPTPGSISHPPSDRQKIRVAGDVQMEEHLFDNQKIFIFSTSGFSNHSEILSRKASAQKDALKKIKNMMLSELTRTPYFYSVDKIIGLYDNGEVVALDYVNDGKIVKIKYRMPVQ